MAELRLPWGEEEWVVPLPDSWQVAQRAEPALRGAQDDWPERLAAAVAQPDSGPALGELLSARRHGNVVLVVKSFSRPSPLAEILEVLMREIHHAGIPDEQVSIQFATSTRPPLTPAQAKEKLGAIVESLAWRCNPIADGGAFTYIGRAGKLPIHIHRQVADADLRILLSSVSPHLISGFTGGYDLLTPGCANDETIRHLHRLSVSASREDRQWVGAAPGENPMRRWIDQAGLLVDQRHGTTFSMQFLPDPLGRPAYIAAGHPLPTHQMLAKQCAVACGVMLESPGDVLIVGAYPRDANLVQMCRAVAQTRWAVHPNAPILCFGRGLAGLGEIRPIPWPLGPAWTRRLIRAVGAPGVTSLLSHLLPNLPPDAISPIRLLAQTLQRNPVFFVCPHLTELGLHFPGIRIYLTPEDAVAAAQKIVGRGAQRVVVFPLGGTSYPIQTIHP